MNTSRNTLKVVLGMGLIGSALGGWMAGSGRVAAQQPNSQPPVTPTYRMPAIGNVPPSSQLMAVLRQAERDNNADALVFSYGQAVTDPQLARGALALLMSDYYRMRAQATTADQASQAVDEAALRFAVMQAAQTQATVQQNQTAVRQTQLVIEQNEVLIRQNQRIIELLEVISKKR